MPCIRQHASARQQVSRMAHHRQACRCLKVVLGGERAKKAEELAAPRQCGAAARRAVLRFLLDILHKGHVFFILISPNRLKALAVHP